MYQVNDLVKYCAREYTKGVNSALTPLLSHFDKTELTLTAFGNNYFESQDCSICGCVDQLID